MNKKYGIIDITTFPEVNSIYFRIHEKYRNEPIHFFTELGKRLSQILGYKYQGYRGSCEGLQLHDIAVAFLGKYEGDNSEFDESTLVLSFGITSSFSDIDRTDLVKVLPILLTQ